MILSSPKSRPRATFGATGAVRGGGVKESPKMTFGEDAELCVMLKVMIVPTSLSGLLSIGDSDCMPSVLLDLGSNATLMKSGVVSTCNGTQDTACEDEIHDPRLPANGAREQLCPL